MIPLFPKPGGGSGLEPLFPILRGVATVFLVAISMLLCGMVGSLAYPTRGVGAIVGAVLGGLISLIFGLFLTGFWKDIAGDKSFGVGALLPHTLAASVGAHGSFDVIVTVHEAIGIEVQGRMPWKRADTYIEILCGANPLKRTCVKGDGRFNEQFKLQVSPADEGIMLHVKDQDIFGASDVGYVFVDIQKDIVDAAFPWRKEFPIEAGENDRLRYGKEQACLVLSFDHTEDYPHSLRTDVSRDMRSKEEAERVWKSKGYGAVSFLSQLEFNPSAKIGKEEAHQRTLLGV